jgi:GntR family transcriptional regulator
VPDPSRAGEIGEFAIALDTGSDLPLYRQIVDHVWLEVAEGTMDPGQRLPTVRQCAIDLGVHPDTVARAYKDLEMLGVVRRTGDGTFVGLKPADKNEVERHAALASLCGDVLARIGELGFTLDEFVETLSESQPPGSSKSGKR